MVALEKKNDISIDDVVALMGKVMAQKDRMISKISTLYKNEQKAFIPASAFTGIKVGDVIALDDAGKSSATCIHVGAQHVIFLTINEKGYATHEHAHDFEEEIQVIKGKIYEQFSEKLAIAGENIVVRPYQMHRFAAQDYSVYTATLQL